MRLNAGGQTAQGLHGFMEAVGVILGHLHGLQLFQSGLLGNLVLALVGIVLQVAHVRDVAYIAYLVANVCEVAEQEVKGDGRTGMSQMGIAIYCGTAYIHAHPSLVQGAEKLLLPAECIVDNLVR